MRRVGITGRANNIVASRQARAIVIATSGVALMALSACTSSSGGNTKAQSPAAHDTTAPISGADSSAPSTTASTPPAGPAIITTSVVTTHRISPSKPVNVGIKNGKLTSVKMVNPAGKTVKGTIAADGSSWHNTEDLGYSKTYKITATGQSAAGTPVTKVEQVTTVTPDNQTMPSLVSIGGNALNNNGTYGVAVVPIVHFDEHVTNEAAAEKALTVTTTPHVDGSWYWSDDQNAHWRPEHYWTTGTKVTISAKVYGVNVGNGLYGQADVSRTFKIGRKQVTVAYDSAPKKVNKVYVHNAAGKVIRTMNTSMGEHSGESVNGNWINFYTMNGTYTVIDHEQPARMCSASYGLPANAPGGYACEDIYNATKISTDGIYLHELLTTIWAQDNGQDVSHGCLNLNAANSLWFFNHSIVGDPVVIHGTKGAPNISVNQGGDWSVPWSQWVKGSALS